MLVVLITLLSHLILYAIEPRPFMDGGHPFFVLGPRCGDEEMGVSDWREKHRRNPDCRVDWEQDLLLRTYTRETWPRWWWDLIPL